MKKTLFRPVYATEDGGETWMEWDGGLARDYNHRSWAFSLAMDPGNPERLWSAEAIGRIQRGEDETEYRLGLHQAKDGGDSWESSPFLSARRLH
jgi:hypothetical protein